MDTATTADARHAEQVRRAAEMMARWEREDPGPFVIPETSPIIIPGR